MQKPAEGKKKKKKSSVGASMIQQDPMVRVDGSPKLDSVQQEHEEPKKTSVSSQTVPDPTKTDYRKQWADAKFPHIQMPKITYKQSDSVFDFERVKKEEEEVIPAPRQKRIGVSFSGGGIRSACFHAGVLQTFAKKNFLYSIDYLSMVSGGAYVGAAYMSFLHACNGDYSLAVKLLTQQMREKVNFFMNGGPAVLHFLSAVLTAAIHNILLGLSLVMIFNGVLFGSAKKQFFVEWIWDIMYFSTLQADIVNNKYTSTVIFSPVTWIVIAALIATICTLAAIAVCFWNAMLQKKEPVKKLQVEEDEVKKKNRVISHIITDNFINVVKYAIAFVFVTFCMLESTKFFIFAYKTYLVSENRENHIFTLSVLIYFACVVLSSIGALAFATMKILPFSIAIACLGLGTPFMFVFSAARIAMWFMDPELSIVLPPMVTIFGVTMDSIVIAEGLAWFYLGYEIIFSEYFNTALHVMYKTRLLKSFYYDGQDVLVHDLPPRPVMLCNATLNNFKSYHIDNSSGQRDYQSFVISQNSIGCDETQYRRTYDVGMDLSEAMTVSAAAVSVNIGWYGERFGSFITRFMFVLLSVNLGSYIHFRTNYQFAAKLRDIATFSAKIIYILFGPGLGIMKCIAIHNKDQALIDHYDYRNQQFIFWTIVIMSANAILILILDGVKANYFEQKEDVEDEEEAVDEKNDGSWKTHTIKELRKYRLSKKRIKSFWMWWPINLLGDFPMIRLVYQVLGLHERESSPYLFLSDGGQFELLGMYELFRRELPLIISFDTSVDPTYTLDELYKTLLLAKNDGWINKVDISAECIDTFRYKKDTLIRHTYGNFFKFKVTYPSIDKGGKRRTGMVWFAKPAMVGSENGFLKLHSMNDDTFPHVTTANQFFDTTLYEAYRRIGKQVAADVLNDFQTDVAPDRSFLTK